MTEQLPEDWVMKPTDHASAHVIPCGDQIEHVTDPDCPCGPTPELVRHSLRLGGWLYVHHSLDGREREDA